MCIAAAPLALIGAGVSALGTGYSALAANAQARGAAAQAEANRTEANRAAVDAIDRGNIDQQRHYREVSRTMGEQRAAFAANGLDIDFGSAASTVADTALYGQEDASTIAENSIREVRGFEISAANFGAEAASARARGQAALVSGAFGMGSTILGGAQQYRKLRESQFPFGTPKQNPWGVKTPGGDGVY